jgi:hypothetical protein
MKRNGRRMHPRPDTIGAEAEQKFKDAGVSLRTDIADFRLKRFGGPRFKPPILVVDEDAAIFHGGLGNGFCAEREAKFRAFGRGNIRPPTPRGDADAAGDFINAIRQPTPIRTGDGEHIGSSRETEGFPPPREVGRCKNEFNTRSNAPRFGADDDFRFHPRNRRDVCRKIARSDFYDFGSIRWKHDGRGHPAADQREIPGG